VGRRCGPERSCLPHGEAEGSIRRSTGRDRCRSGSTRLGAASARLRVRVPLGRLRDLLRQLGAKVAAGDLRRGPHMCRLGLLPRWQTAARFSGHLNLYPGTFAKPRASGSPIPRRDDQHQLGAHAWFAVQAVEKLTSCPLRTEDVQCHMLSVLRDDRVCSLAF